MPVTDQTIAKLLVDDTADNVHRSRPDTPDTEVQLPIVYVDGADIMVTDVVPIVVKVDKYTSIT